MATRQIFILSAPAAIFGVFFFESAVLGQWIPRIPDIKATLGLSDGELGLALLAMPLGTLIGFSIAGKIIESTGLRQACRLFLPLWALLFVTPGLAQSYWQLSIALVFCGLAVSMIETAMNTEAARIERSSGVRIMSRCHGFWSLGTMVGALLGGAIAQAGIGVDLHFIIILPIIALFGFWFATKLPPSVQEPDLKNSLNTTPVEDSAAVTDSSIFRLPSPQIILLCIMPMGIMMVEGAFIDWSAVFMRDLMQAEPMTIGVIYAAFSLVMAITRLSGDTLASRYGDLAVVRCSGIAACVGIFAFAMSPNTQWAFVAAAVSGAGVAIVFPIAVSAVANRPVRTPADNVAALNLISFSAFLIAPPFIGFVSEVLNLRFALVVLAPLAFTTFILAKEIKNT